MVDILLIAAIACLYNLACELRNILISGERTSARAHTHARIHSDTMRPSLYSASCDLTNHVRQVPHIDSTNNYIVQFKIYLGEIYITSAIYKQILYINVYAYRDVPLINRCHKNRTRARV